MNAEELQVQLPQAQLADAYPQLVAKDDQISRLPELQPLHVTALAAKDAQLTAKDEQITRLIELLQCAHRIETIIEHPYRVASQEAEMRAVIVVHEVATRSYHVSPARWRKPRQQCARQLLQKKRLNG